MAKQIKSAYLRAQLGFCAAGLALAAMMAMSPGGKAIAPYGFFLVSLTLPVGGILFGAPVLIHELGHLLAARRLGLKVVSFVIFGFDFMSGNYPPPQGEFWGFVRVETTYEQDRPAVWVPFLLAGPIANLLGVVIGIGSTFTTGGLIQSILFFEIYLGLVLIIASFCRSPGPLPVNDGEKIRDVRSKDSAVFAMTALRRLATSTHMNRDDHIDAKDLELAMKTKVATMQAIATSFDATYALDCEPIRAVDATQQYLKACTSVRNSEPQWEPLSNLYQDAVLESAYCSALFSRDAKASEALLDSVDSLDRPNWQAARRAYAALAYAQGNTEEALARINTARQHLARENEVIHRLSRKLLDRVERAVHGLDPTDSLEDHDDQASHQEH